MIARVLVVGGTAVEYRQGDFELVSQIYRYPFNMRNYDLNRNAEASSTFVLCFVENVHTHNHRKTTNNPFEIYVLRVFFLSLEPQI